MNPTLLDTDILSLYLRNHKIVQQNVEDYVKIHNDLMFSIVTYYEIVSGFKHRDAHKQFATFLAFVEDCTILPVTERSATHSSEWYAKLRSAGTPVDDMDLLIAGIALEHDMTLATHNVRHFGRIEGLTICDWSVESLTS